MIAGGPDHSTIARECTGACVRSKHGSSRFFGLGGPVPFVPSRCIRRKQYTCPRSLGGCPYHFPGLSCLLSIAYTTAYTFCHRELVLGHLYMQGRCTEMTMNGKIQALWLTSRRCLCIGSNLLLLCCPTRYSSCIDRPALKARLDDFKTWPEDPALLKALK